MAGVFEFDAGLVRARSTASWTRILGGTTRFGGLVSAAGHCKSGCRHRPTFAGAATSAIVQPARAMDDDQATEDREDERKSRTTRDVWVLEHTSDPKFPFRLRIHTHGRSEPILSFRTGSLAWQ